MYSKLMTCLASVKEKIDFKPEVALILGSGLGDYADEIRIVDIPRSRASRCQRSRDIRDASYSDMWRRRR